MTPARVFFCFLSSVVLFSCQERRDTDACCSFVEGRRGVTVLNGDGALVVEGSTPTRFRVSDESGQQIATQLLNQSAQLPAGIYRVSVNNVVCIAEVREDRVSRCSTGTLKVAGATKDDFVVSDTTGRSLASAQLNKSLSLFPGDYTVTVNNTTHKVTVRAKELTEVRTGTLIVHGANNDYYHVLDKNNRQLKLSRLEESLAFFPGTYPVKVNNTSMDAEIYPGRVTSLATGLVLVRGLTDENYYVTDSLGNALNYQSLNKPLTVFPGSVRIKLNNSAAHGIVTAGDTLEIATGSIVLTGKGTEYFHILDEDGKVLHYNSLNRSLSLFPSGYVIKMGQSLRKATVNAGELTTVTAFDARD